MTRPRKLTDEQRLENKLKARNSEVNKQRRRENAIIYYYKKKIRLLEEKEKEIKLDLEKLNLSNIQETKNAL
jgi:hypothetical protein